MTMKTMRMMKMTKTMREVLETHAAAQGRYHISIRQYLPLFRVPAVREVVAGLSRLPPPASYSLPRISLSWS
jgi:hypothetical protein